MIGLAKIMFSFNEGKLQAILKKDKDGEFQII